MHVLRELSGDVDDLLAAGTFFWLDLDNPDEGTVRDVGERFGLHPLALEDSNEFGQRPKLDDYGDTALMVFYGLDAKGRLDEVHLHLSGRWMVTIHREHCKALARAMQRIADEPPRSEEEAIYRLLDSLTDSFFDPLDAMDDEIDVLMDTMIQRPRPEQRSELLSLRRRLVDMRRIVAPQRDMLARGGDLIARIPGLEKDEAHDWLRDIYDHQLRISELIDSFRDILAGALDIYLSTVSNRLNEVMKQLTILSVVFLPLTFVTGFFGQNFGWMTDHIDSLAAFLLLGGGSLALSVTLMIVWFRRSGFLGSDDA